MSATAQNCVYIINTKEQGKFIKNAPVVSKKEMRECKKIVEKYTPKKK